MPILEVKGKRVEVGNEFLQMSPEERDLAVEEIAQNIPDATAVQGQDQSVAQSAEGGLGPDPSSRQPSPAPSLGAYRDDMEDTTPPTSGDLPLAADEGSPAIVDDNNNVISPAQPSWSGNNPIEANTDMYSNADTGEEAFDIYRQAKQNPENSNRIVPPPTYNWQKDIPIIGDYIASDQPYVVSNNDIILGGAANAVKEGAKTATSISDTAINTVSEAAGSDFRNDGARAIEENVPEMVAAEDDAMDELLLEGTSALAGAQAGVNSARTGIEILRENTGRLARGIRIAYEGLAAGVGSTAALDEDTQRLLVEGNESLTNALPAMPETNDPNQYSEKVLTKKLNNLYDTLIAGGVAAGLGESVSKLTSIANKEIIQRIRGIWSVKQGGLAGMDKFLSSIVENPTSDQKREMLERTKQWIQENRQKIMPTPKGDEIEVNLNPLDAIIQGMRKEGGEFNRATSVERQRKTLSNSGMAPVVKKDMEYENQTDDFFAQLFEQEGGEQAAQQSVDDLVTSGQQRVGAVRAAEENADVLAQEAREELSNRIRNDPEFGSKVRALENNTGINILEGQNRAGENLANKITKAGDNLNEARQEAINRIPAGVTVDEQPLNNALEEVVASDAVQRLPRRLRGAIIDRDSEELYDFKWLQDNVATKLNESISDIRSVIDAGSVDAPILREQQQALTNLRNHLNYEQPELIASRYGDELGEQATQAFQDYRAANQKFMDFFPPESKTRELYDSAKRQKSNPSFGGKNQEKANRRNLVEKSFGNGDYENAETVVKLLNTREGGKTAKSLDDYLGNKIIEDLGPKIRSGDLSEITEEDILSAGKNYGATIQRRSPVFKRVNSLVQDVKNGRATIEMFEEQAEEAGKAARQAEKEVFEGELGRFLNRTKSGGFEQLEDVDRVFDKIFKSNTDEKQMNEIRNLMKSADNASQEGFDPETIKQGIRASFGKYLQGTKALGAKTLDKELEQIQKVDKIIYGEDNVITQGIENAINLVRMKDPSANAKDLKEAIPSTLVQEGKSALDKVITAVVGPLSRAGVRTKGVSNTLVQGTNVEDEVRNLIGFMHSDSDTFLDIADQYLKATNQGDANAAIARMSEAITSTLKAQGGENEPEFLNENATKSRKEMRNTEPTGFLDLEWLR